MLKVIAGVIAGYGVMLVLVIVFGVAAFLSLGADRAFAPGAYTPSVVWMALALACALLAAIAGGWICAAIGGGRAARVLAAVVFVLGMLFLYPVFVAEDLRPTTRVSGEAFLASMQNARQPAWIAVLNPIIGAVGVLIGARRNKR